MLARFRASRDGDLARIRELQAEYDDLMRAVDECEREREKLDDQIERVGAEYEKAQRGLEEQYDQVLGDLEAKRDEAVQLGNEHLDEMGRIDAELDRFPQDLIDEASR